MAEDLLRKLYVQDVEEWQKDLSKKRFSDKKPEVQVVERGIILPARKVERILYGGVCDENFNFVTGFSQRPNNGGGNIAICINKSYTVEREELIQLNEDVIFGGTVVGHFGHFLVECWSRLWYVIQNPDLKTKILFIISYRGYKPWFDEFFKLMGIDTERIIYISKPTQCRSITVPEQSQYNPRIFTKEFLIPYQAIKSRIKPSEKKKLYLTRTKFAQGVQCYNEQYFEDFFVAHGFEAISMEKLKLVEQISLIMGADEIAATMGTLTHWALFCRPETKFIMLTRTHEPLDYQSFINEASGVDYCIVDASKNFMYAHRNGAGACFLGANKYWKEFVADYFGEQIDEYDDSLYIENSLDKYINFWCEKYSPADNLNIWVSSLKDMCNRIIALEKEKVRNRPLLTYQTHVGSRGWQSWKGEEQFSNELDQQFDIQAIRIAFSKPFHEIYYSVYYNAQEGWSEEVSTAETAGTTGKSKSITGIKIQLDEAGASDFDILYRAHKFDGEWTSWAKNGEELLSGDAKLNSLQIKLNAVKKQRKSPSMGRPLLAYQTHVGGKGWLSWQGEGHVFSNLLNQKADIQAIRVAFLKPFHEIYYSVYYNAQEGWSDEVSTAEVAGTTGKSKSITGIKIRLDESGAENFDIFYRVHKFDGEWTSWAKNGEELLSGGVKLNSLQINLEAKSNRPSLMRA